MTRSFSAVALLLATGFVITDGLLTPSRSHVVNSNRPHTMRLPGDGLSFHYGLNSGELSPSRYGVFGLLFPGFSVSMDFHL